MKATTLVQSKITGNNIYDNSSKSPQDAKQQSSFYVAYNTTNMSFTHPLSPLQPSEIRQGAAILRSHLRSNVRDLRVKLIDLQEPSKHELIKFNEHSNSPSATSIHRRARIYYHIIGSTELGKAIVDITSATVEHDEKRDDVQGPVDWTEYAEVHDVCNSHPAVLAEIEKLKLPPGYALHAMGS